MWSSGGWRRKGDPSADQALSSTTSSVGSKSSAAATASVSKRGSARPSKKADANRQLANIIKRNREATVKQVDNAPRGVSRVVKPAGGVSKHRVTATLPEKEISSSTTSHTIAAQRATTFPRREPSPGPSDVNRSFTGGKIGTLQKRLNLNALLAGGPPGGARPRAMGSGGPSKSSNPTSGVLTGSGGAAPMFLSRMPAKAKGDDSSVMTKDTKCPEMEHHTLTRPRRARTKRPSRQRFSQEAVATLAASPSSLLDDLDVVPLLDDASWEDELAAA